MKKILILTAVAAVFFYLKQNESKKRFFKEILRQVPYLVPRYFA